jgi:diacylglycerol kinase (ATP)
LEGIKDLGSIRPYPVRIETPEQQFDEAFIFGAVSSSTSIAGLFSLNEELISFDDGLFEVLLIRPPGDARALIFIINALRTQN